MHLLFSYGTLRQPEVQRAVFGGEVAGEDDAVVGHRLGEITVDDPRVVELSGKSVHLMLIPDEEAGEVSGTLFRLTDEQLARADDYEVDAYERVEVPLRSGRTAWVYALA
ncbi:gamma-glutamylcyclotransferase family protein [Salininema proteolyticum]|uniref:Gamma-glutamylcyclotransferase family protein n=1 Tax=Salininema proteolyticum TaxID=1607685 RepID=A0ABV8U1X3_9ACTN